MSSHDHTLQVDSNGSRRYLITVLVLIMALLLVVRCLHRSHCIKERTLSSLKKSSQILKEIQAAPKSTSQVSRRNASIFSRNPFKKNSKVQDNLPEDFVLIFSNQNIKPYRYSLLFIMSGIGSLIYYCNRQDLWSNRDDSLYYPVAVLSIIGFCISMLCVVLRCSMHRIYKNAKTGQYVGVRPSWIFFSQKYTFRLSDVEINKRITVSKLPKMFRVDNNYIKGNLRIKDRPYVLSVNHFSAPKFYNEIHGYENVNVDK